MKNRVLNFLIIALIFLAVVGVGSKLVLNPTGFFQGIAVMLITGGIIYFVITRYIFKSSHEKREQKAFVKAAKRSLKKHQQKEPSQQIRRKKNHTNLTTIKKGKTKKNQPNSHLTVIEGKKGTKKNRALF